MPISPGTAFRGALPDSWLACGGGPGDGRESRAGSGSPMPPRRDASGAEKPGLPGMPCWRPARPWPSWRPAPDAGGDYHVFGTDKVGQDVLYQVLKSVRTGLIIGLVTTLVTLPLAIVLGIVAGYFRGWVDDLIQYVYTVLNSIPGCCSSPPRCS